MSVGLLYDESYDKKECMSNKSDPLIRGIIF
jgi:hypothetical protein